METVKKLAKILEECDCRHSAEHCDICPYIGEEGCLSYFETAKKLVEHGVTIATDTNGKWVSVDERLPEYGSCLVVVKYKYKWEDHYNYDVDVAQLCYENDPYRIDGKWVTFNDWDEWRDEIHITHWMPLPEPPKGVQE